MSYTNTTTHYGWPLPEETDLFNGLDDNQMKEDLDEKIYNLEQRSTGDHEAVTQLNTRVTEVEQTVGGYDDEIEQLQGSVNEHAERLVNLTNRQTELSRRLNGKAGESTIAPEYNEEESYLVGDFVYYANILYKCATASATPAGEFDSDNWDIVILTDELGGSTPGPIAAADVSFDDTLAQLGANNAQAAIVALKTLIDSIGGGAMPILDYSNPLHTLVNGTAFTATSDCYVVGNLNVKGTSGTPSATLTINSNVVYSISATDQFTSATSVPVFLKVKSGDVITMSNDNGGALKVYAEAQ